MNAGIRVNADATMTQGLMLCVLIVEGGLMLRYYNKIIENFNDMEAINEALNLAIRDQKVKSADYSYLSTVAKSLGFDFGEHFRFI